ncbi:polysaccharide deacetylase family protein [Brevibacterium ravenspurgense]|uniref:polysaccharide deacetylase family protein n=1 Tax=Brevibacterium ravenspurgense TaxID=479117 RepID=UPI00078298B5|nr:polysaccharide deacetylase family protein [Brevibacterium ravenspurgense]
MRFSSVGCILAASLIFTGCAIKGDDKPGTQVSQGDVTIPAERVKDELPGLLRSYAVQTKEASVNLFGIPGQESLNETLEEAALKALEEAGAFKGRKAFQPEVTAPQKRWDEAEYLALDGLSAEDESTKASDAGTAGSEPSEAGGSGNTAGGDSEVSVESHIVGAGGDYLVTQLDVRAGGTTTSQQFLTDTKNNATEPMDSIKAEGVEGQIAVAGDKITVGGEDAGDDKLRESGKKLAGVLGEGLTIEAKENPYLPDFTCALLPCAAITYDDGPADEALTERLGDALDEAKVRATFFEIGRNVENLPENTRTLFEAGHEMENHSFSHPVLSKLSADKQKSEIDKTDKAVYDATGEYPTMLRPPYGASNKRLTTVVQGDGTLGESAGAKATAEPKGQSDQTGAPTGSESPAEDSTGGSSDQPTAGGKAKKADGVKTEHGKALIMWDVDTLDWQHRDPAYVTQVALANTKPGSIVLMHAIHPTTIDASPGIFSGLQGKGFYLVPVGYMFKDMKLEAGKEYFCRGYHGQLCSTPEHPYVEKES